MKNKKLIYLGIAAFILVILIFNNDSSTSSSTDIVKEENNTIDTENDSKVLDEIAYEITDSEFEYYTTAIGSIEYYAFVEVTNTGNNNLYLEKATFDLEDDDGHLLQTDDYISTARSVIKPGEKGYFYNGLGANIIDESVSLENGINIVPQITVKRATGEPAIYEVEDTDIREGSSGSPKVTGRVVNNTEEDCEYLYLNIIFYDEKGKVLAITGTSITDLNAGSKVSFECDAMFANDNVTLDRIADYQVVAEDMYMQF